MTDTNTTSKSTIHLTDEICLEYSKSVGTTELATVDSEILSAEPESVVRDSIRMDAKYEEIEDHTDQAMPRSDVPVESVASQLGVLIPETSHTSIIPTAVTPNKEIADEAFTDKISGVVMSQTTSSVETNEMKEAVHEIFPQSSALTTVLDQPSEIAALVESPDTLLPSEELVAVEVEDASKENSVVVSTPLSETHSVEHEMTAILPSEIEKGKLSKEQQEKEKLNHQLPINTVNESIASTEMENLNVYEPICTSSTVLQQIELQKETQDTLHTPTLATGATEDVTEEQSVATQITDVSFAKASKEELSEQTTNIEIAPTAVDETMVTMVTEEVKTSNEPSFFNATVDNAAVPAESGAKFMTATNIESTASDIVEQSVKTLPTTVVSEPSFLSEEVEVKLPECQKPLSEAVEIESEIMTEGTMFEEVVAKDTAPVDIVDNVYQQGLQTTTTVRAPVLHESIENEEASDLSVSLDSIKPVMTETRVPEKNDTETLIAQTESTTITVEGKTTANVDQVCLEQPVVTTTEDDETKTDDTPQNIESHITEVSTTLADESVTEILHPLFIQTLENLTVEEGSEAVLSVKVGGQSVKVFILYKDVCLSYCPSFSLTINFCDGFIHACLVTYKYTRVHVSITPLGLFGQIISISSISIYLLSHYVHV